MPKFLSFRRNYSCSGLVGQLGIIFWPHDCTCTTYFCCASGNQLGFWILEPIITWHDYWAFYVCLPYYFFSINIFVLLKWAPFPFIASEMLFIFVMFLTLPIIFSVNRFAKSLTMSFSHPIVTPCWIWFWKNFLARDTSTIGFTTMVALHLLQCFHLVCKNLSYLFLMFLTLLCVLLHI